MLAAPKQTASANDKPTAYELYLAAYDGEKKTFSLQPCTLDGEPVTWAGDNLPLVARLADRVALLWTEGQSLKFATCGLTGQLPATAEMDVFERQPPDARGQQVLEIFLWGLLFAILVPMFVLRPKTPPKPFELPPTMRPANPIKRLLAGLMDFIPWGMFAVAIWQIAPMSLEEMQQMAEKGMITANHAYAFVTWLLLYAAYGIAMERLFGATLGKMLFKLRVVGDGGVRPGARGILLRNLVRIVELTWPLALPLLLLMPLFTRSRQRLGDMMARTTVIDTSFVPPPPEEPADEQPTQDD